jgi:hypothetical protein
MAVLAGSTLATNALESPLVRSSKRDRSRDPIDMRTGNAAFIADHLTTAVRQPADHDLMELINVLHGL